MVDFLDLLEQFLVGKKATAAGHDLIKADDSLLVDYKVGAPGAVPLFIVDTVGLDHFLAPGVTEEGIIQIERFRKSLLRETHIGADAQDLCIQRLKLGIVVPTGRQLSHSPRCEVKDVKLNENVFPPQATEFEFPTHGAAELEIWGFFTHLNGTH